MGHSDLLRAWDYGHEWTVISLFYKKYDKNFILVPMYVHIYPPWLERGSQSGSQLSASIMWVSGIELRWSTLPVEPYYQLLACVPRD